VQAPKSDIFVVMLAIALGAIILGCLLMTIQLAGYGFSTTVSMITPSLSHVVTNLAEQASCTLVN
jgi:hypothetical protein